METRGRCQQILWRAFRIVLVLVALSPTSAAPFLCCCWRRAAAFGNSLAFLHRIDAHVRKEQLHLSRSGLVDFQDLINRHIRFSLGIVGNVGVEQGMSIAPLRPSVQITNMLSVPFWACLWPLSLAARTFMSAIRS